MSQAAQVAPVRKYSLFAWRYAQQFLVFLGAVRLNLQAILRIPILPNAVLLIFSYLGAVYQHRRPNTPNRYGTKLNCTTKAILTAIVCLQCRSMARVFMYMRKGQNKWFGVRDFRPINYEFS